VLECLDVTDYDVLTGLLKRIARPTEP
jgi:hypothetical protein